jgi:DNA repair exonuclease SbcCD nuclease subunit
MKTLIVGDLHAGINRNNSIYHRTLLKYALWIKRLCVERGINHIIQLGDVFDNRNQISVETLNIVSKFFEILKDFTIDITIGNHDALYNDHSKVNSLVPFKEHPNITIHENVTKRGDMVFTGWGVKLEDIPECRLLFGHYDTIGFELQKGKVSSHGFKASDLMEKVSGAVYTGHYHRPQLRHYNKKPLHYVGSAYPLDWNDADDTKFVYILDTDTLALETIENTVSPRFNYIRNEEDLDKIEGNFVSIKYTLGEVGDKWVSKIQAFKPLAVKTELLSDNVKQIETDIADFKVVKIEDIIEEWVTASLANIDDDSKKEVAKLAKMRYINKK